MFDASILSYYGSILRQYLEVMNSVSDGLAHLSDYPYTVLRNLPKDGPAIFDIRFLLR